MLWAMLWSIDSGTLRLVLRVYFITMTALLGIIGSECCKCAAKVDLLKGKNVKLNRMTGWLRPVDILTCIYKLKRLPGGAMLGFVMIITTLLSLTADLMVSKLVLPTAGLGKCLFTTGLVMNWESNETFVSPPANGYPALIASNAQIYSSNSNCSVGIYEKVPYSGDPAFCGRAIDILGRWECGDQNMDKTFDSSLLVSSIEDSLFKSGLQYSNRSYWDYYNTQQQSTHLVIWSSSIGSDATGSPFDVLVSVDLYSSVTGVTDTKTMKTFKCSAKSNSTDGQTAVNSILAQMESVSALYQWTPGLERMLYTGANTNAVSDAGPQLEQYLNTMTMVQGGSNSVLGLSKSLEYGCIKEKTKISMGIVGLVFFTAFLLLVTFLYWILLLLIISKHALTRVAKRKSGVAVKNIKPVPDSVIGWMLQAARESVQGMEAHVDDAPKKEENLREWGFTMVDRTHGVAKLVPPAGSVTLVSEVNVKKV